MIRRLRDFLLARRLPAGYRPGLTLGHLLRNLGPVQVEWLEPSVTVIGSADLAWRAELRECVQAHLLMHIVTCEFRLNVPAPKEGEVRLELRHTGTLRRTGIACVYRGGDESAFARVRDLVASDAALLADLMPLDFKRLSLQRRSGQWQVTMEHMGGSEVVNRMPAFRRYIQLSPGQRSHVLGCLTRLSEVLQGI